MRFKTGFTIIPNGVVLVSTGVLEGRISEPWTLATLKRGKSITDNNEFAFAA